jgi:hypothetical protein
MMDALSMDLRHPAAWPTCAPSLPVSGGLVCHTPQPIPPIDDDDDDDEDDDDDRGSGGGNIDPDEDEGSFDDDEDDDETPWSAPGFGGSRRPLGR